MKIIRSDVSREEVVHFYAAYDCRKKRQGIPDPTCWPSGDPGQLDNMLLQHGLKHGVVAGYKLWWLAELEIADLLDCAIVNVSGFPGQSLALLAQRGAVASWIPPGPTEWFDLLSQGGLFPPDWAMILRPSTLTERPAKWYIEDGSGRALCLLQRILRHSEYWRTAYGYIGIMPDEKSAFFSTRPELLARTKPTGA
jgi:hypothetical protein